MAEFLRMEVRGIRSVGCNDDDVQYFEFLSPCTLISGPNGTGKTTTIEALNYVTTGTLPPLKLQAFIQSRELSHRSRVDASVALEFRDIKGRICTATRRMSAVASGSGKSRKIKCQSEEFTLHIKYNDGHSTSLSSKNIDFDAALLKHLGVPKAIFNYVIFCHQEDSTWPLSEPKELKERFDQIFEVTKFVKAQEQLKKIKKSYENKLSVNTVNVKRYADLLKQKYAINKKINDLKYENQEFKNRLDTIRRNIDDKINERREMESKLSKYENVSNMLENKKIELSNLIEKLEILNVENYRGTEDELNSEIVNLKNSDSSRAIKEQEIRFQKELHRISQEVNRLEVEKRQLEEMRISLTAKSINHEKLKKKIDNLSIIIRKDLEINENTNLSVQLIESIVDNKKKIMLQNMKIAEEDSAEFEEEIEAVQKKLTTIESEFSNFNENRIKLEREKQEIENKLEMTKNSSLKIDEFNQEIIHLEQELENISNINVNSMKDLYIERDRTTADLDQLKIMKNEAERFSDTEKEIETKEKLLNENSEKLNQYVGKHNWSEMNPEWSTPEFPLTSHVRKLNLSLQSELKTVESSLNESQLSEKEINTIIKQLESDDEKTSSMIIVREEEIFELCECNTENVEAKLKEVRKELKRARNELSPLKAKIVLYDSWIGETKTNSCCPLCDRKFNSKKGVDDLSQKLHDITIEFPNEEEKLEKEILHLEIEEKKLTKAVGFLSEIRNSKEKLSEIRDKLNENRFKIQKIKSIVAEQTIQKEKLDKKIQKITQIQMEVGVMDSTYDNINKINSELAILKKKLKRKEFKESNEELSQIIKKKEMEYKEIVLKLDELQCVANRKNVLNSKINEVREQRIKINEMSNQSSHLEEALEKRSNELNSVINKLIILEREKPAVENRLEALKIDKQQRNNELRQQEAKIIKESAKLTDLLEDYKCLRKEVDEQRMDYDFNSVMEKLNKCNDELNHLENRRRYIENDCANLKNQETKLDILQKQLKKMRLEKQKAVIELEIEQLKDSNINKDDISKMRNYLRSISNQLEMDGKEEAKCEALLKNNENMYKNESELLKDKDINDADGLFHKVSLDGVLLDETIKDIEKYLECLDKSIIKFHTEKLEAINNIIDELWRTVYKSSDIVTIRIRSKTNETGVRNRSYDYTVVMIQDGGNEVEMRGRCSAGQKMIASLIIRIALAEVFGGLCSMIALDEPTTNLDEANVEGMAEILLKLIDARRISYEVNGERIGRDMQIIVITHDESFINYLIRGCSPEYVYCLSKNQYGLSCLKKRFPDGRLVDANKR